MDRRKFLKGAVGFAGVTATSTLIGSSRAESLPISGTKAKSILQPLKTQSNDLRPYTGLWTDIQLWHLLRRSMFGVPLSQFNEAKSLGSLNVVVDRLLANGPLPTLFAEYVNEFPLPDYEAKMLVDPDQRKILNNNRRQKELAHGQQVRNWWIARMLNEQLSLREKMTLFWSNHFVVQAPQVKSAAYLFTYNQTLRKNALGNFKQFVYEISVDPAMLVYLNGDHSFNGRNPQGKLAGNHVNENYARELMELFTLGIRDPKTGEPNYTEQDIQNSAQALSGWRPTQSAPYVGVFYPESHNNGLKTFFGQTANFDLQSIIDAIFAKNGGYNVAHFICEKIYMNFVHWVPNETVVDQMAKEFVRSNWDITSVMRSLLTSAHFYDRNLVGAQLKSPVEFTGSLLREFQIALPAFDPSEPMVTGQNKKGIDQYSDSNPSYSFIASKVMGQALGQELLNPPNVKGWQGGTSWISTGTLQARKQIADKTLQYPSAFDGSKQSGRNAIDVAGKAKGKYGNQGYVKAAFVPKQWVSEVMGDKLNSETIAKKLEEATIAVKLGPKESQALYSSLNSLKLPETDFYLKEEYISAFARAIAKLPEFQLI